MSNILRYLCKTNCIDNYIIDESPTISGNISGLVIYYGNAQNSVTNMQECKSLLSVMEGERMNKLIFDADELTFCISHGLLRISLAKFLNLSSTDLIFEFSSKGRPYLPRLNADFNLTHSKNYFAYIITNKVTGRVGIDIEKRCPLKRINSIVNNYMHYNEQCYILDNSISSDNQLSRFYEIWTRKEAFLKMLGLGIGINLSDLDMVDGYNETCLEKPEDFCINNDMIYLNTMISKEFVLSTSTNFNIIPGIIEH